jgi:hypothetical protein
MLELYTKMIFGFFLDTQFKLTIMITLLHSIFQNFLLVIRNA